MAQTAIAPAFTANEPRNALTDLSRSVNLIDPTAGNVLKQYNEGLYVSPGASVAKLPQHIFSNSSTTGNTHATTISGYPCTLATLPTATAGYGSTVPRLGEFTSRLYPTWIAPSASYIQANPAGDAFELYLPPPTDAARTSLQNFEGVRALKDCLLQLDVSVFLRLKLGESVNQLTAAHSLSGAAEARTDGLDTGNTGAPAGSVFTHRTSDRAWAVISNFVIFNVATGTNTEYRFGEDTVNLNPGNNAALVTAGHDLMQTGVLTIPVKTGDYIYVRSHASGLNANSNRTYVSLYTQALNHFTIREIPTSY